MVDQANPNAPAHTGLTPKFLSLGDGNELLQVAFAPGDSILAAELAFCYRGIGLRSEIQPVGAVERALGWIGLKNDRIVKWTNEGTAPAYIGLAASLPGKVIPVDLGQSGTILVKSRAFLCSVGENNVTAKKLTIATEGPFSRYHIEMRRLSGSGVCYIQGAGAVVQKRLANLEATIAEIGCIAAVSHSCRIEYQVGLIREPPYSQGLLVKVSGPGIVFFQSTHAARISKHRSTQRTRSVGNEMMKVAVFTIGILVVFFAFLESPNVND